MRFSLAILGLAAAASATAIDAKAGADVDAQIGAGVDAGVDAGAKTGADIDANVDAGATVGAAAGVKAGADVGAGVKAGADVDAQTGAGVDAGLDAGAKVGADVDANIGAGAAVGAAAGAGAAAGVKAGANVGAGVGAGVKAGADVGAGVGAGVKAGADVDVAAGVNDTVATGAGVGAGVGAGIGAGLQIDSAVKAQIDAAVKGFTCPNTMIYCPWTKSCSCEPGLSWDAAAKTCVGTALTGAWPEPSVDVYASVHVELAKFCAVSPTKLCVYDAAHEYCQVGLETITFVADAKVAAEVKLMGDAEIDVHGDVSAELKAVSAGLHGLYLESAADAVALFNTKAYGLHVLEDNIAAALKAGFATKTQLTLCKLGLGSCQRDCVSFSQKGCANHIDIGAQIGAQIEGLSGLCILPSIILCMTQAKAMVTVAVEHMLCIVGSIIKTVIATFDCHCK